MSKENNMQEAMKQQNLKKQRVMSNHQNEEFGSESSFNAKPFKEERKFSSKNKIESERTTWN